MKHCLLLFCWVVIVTFCFAQTGAEIPFNQVKSNKKAVPTMLGDSLMGSSSKLLYQFPARSKAQAGEVKTLLLPVNETIWLAVHYRRLTGEEAFLPMMHSVIMINGEKAEALALYKPVSDAKPIAFGVQGTLAEGWVVLEGGGMLVAHQVETGQILPKKSYSPSIKKLLKQGSIESLRFSESGTLVLGSMDSPGNDFSFGFDVVSGFSQKANPALNTAVPTLAMGSFSLGGKRTPKVNTTVGKKTASEAGNTQRADLPNVSSVSSGTALEDQTAGLQDGFQNEFEGKGAEAESLLGQQDSIRAAALAQYAAIQAYGKEAADSVQALGRARLDSAKQAGKAAIEDYKKQGKAAADSLKQLAGGAADSIKAMGKAQYEAYKAEAKAAADSLKQLAGGAADSIKAMGKAQYEAYKAQGKAAADSLKAAGKEAIVAAGEEAKEQAKEEVTSAATEAVSEGVIGATDQALESGFEEGLGAIETASPGLLPKDFEYAGIGQVLEVARKYHASKEANVWLFGSGAGIQFSDSASTVLTESSMDQLEGCAAVADSLGRLLMYSDGQNIYNRRHAPMLHGDSLLGHASSSTAALIVPQPGQPYIYYVFTADEGGYIKGSNRGVHFSVVDMRLDGGLGAVTGKNVQLVPKATERMALVRHGGGKDIWVITQPNDSNVMLAYRLTVAGILDKPAVSKAPFQTGMGNSSIGLMTASPDGQWLAWTNPGTWEVQLFRFDADNGTLKVGVELSHALREVKPDQFMERPYGISFSPDSKKLYVGSWSGAAIHQFDLSQKGENAIAISHYRWEGKEPEKGKEFGYGALQLSPDGRIYGAEVALGNEPRHTLTVIESPNEAGASARYKEAKVSMGEGIVRSGLPAFLNDFLLQTRPDFAAKGFCAGSPTNFFAYAQAVPETWSWYVDLGDSLWRAAGSGPAVEYTFRKAGNYRAMLITQRAAFRDTVEQRLSIWQEVDVDLGPDKSLANSQSSLLTAQVTGGDASAAYLWSTGETTESIQPMSPGVYSVRVLSGGCSASDEVRVLPAPAGSHIVQAHKPQGFVVSSYNPVDWLHGLSRVQIKTVSTPGLQPVHIATRGRLIMPYMGLGSPYPAFETAGFAAVPLPNMPGSVSDGVPFGYRNLGVQPNPAPKMPIALGVKVGL